jgi:membrane protease YdiL (CAAX protease family)
MINNTAVSGRERVNELGDKNRVGSLVDILIAFSPLLIIGSIGEWLGDGTALGAVLINVAYVLCIGLATVVLKRRGVGWGEIGLARPGSWLKTVLLGVGALIGYILANLALQGILQLLPGLEMAPSDQSSFNALVGNLPLLLIYVAAAWTIIAFGEEMLFRAFLINSLAVLFRKSKATWALAGLVSSLAFGLAHFSWGLAGVIETTLLGLILTFVYLRTGRNLWVTIIAHGIGNTLGFLLVYSGAA